MLCVCMCFSLSIRLPLAPQVQVLEHVVERFVKHVKHLDLHSGMYAGQLRKALERLWQNHKLDLPEP